MAWINRLFRLRDIWVLLAGVVLMQLLLMVVIDRYMFHPVRGGYTDKTHGYVDIGRDGDKIATFVWGPTHGKAAIIYCHGNAEDATSAGHRFTQLVSEGYTVASVDYPGYGLSSGSPNEIGCYKVTHRLYDWLKQERGFAPNEIFVIGYSIGTGVAVELASAKQVAGLWLEAPYLSAPRIVTRVRLLFTDPFPSCSRIGRVGCPVVIVHGMKDHVIPPSQGEALYELAREPKSLLLIPNGDHTDFADVYGEGEYLSLLREFISGKHSFL